MSAGAVVAPLRAGDLLAVYGLLRPGCGGLETLGLERAARALGPCRLPGALYDLGAYPGFVLGAGETSGELLRLLAARAGPALDAYEDFDPRHPRRPGYVRERVRLAAPRVTAWVYVWRGPLAGRAPIAGGDWPAYVAGRGRDL
ncbi:MAG: gamma-glutamylcyclotransferase [Caulobacterales bacterium]|nr:gamma-glutamylcyclotransferase [Caulobacterales bacterium]